MQSLDDDMDELFRRAGEQYPLNTGGADWNKVMQELHPADEVLPEKNNNKYKFLWLLLLLPIGFICGRYVGNGKKTAVETNKSSATNAAPADQPAQAKSSHEKVGNSKPIKDEERTDEARTKKTENASAIKNAASVTVNTLGSLQHTAAPNKFAQQTRTTRQEKTVLTNQTSTTAAAINKHNDSPSPAILQEQVNVEKDVVAPTTEDRPVLNDNTNHTEDANKKAVETDTLAAPVTGAAKDKKQPPSKRRFYYSLVIGPDLSMVKQEKPTKVGYSVGLLLGLQLTPKLSIEAGALWDRKNYYALGQDLDTSRLALPRHSIVSAVDGYCDMIEIPVNVKYSFATRAGQGWFISAGLSSNLMKKEEYSLSYKLYNQPYVKDYGYKNSSTDWFSIASISAGYQKTIGKHTNISVAPYIKLPLRGVGIGKLPIRSTGIYIGLSRSIQ